VPPPGYVGYDEGGYLTEAVRRRPYSVVLLDEIEKAHPDIFNVLLQVLDDGRMTDGKGRTVDFTNTILIMTSNLGSSLIMKMAEEHASHHSINQQIEEILHQQFKPEFLNRIDETIIFHSLSKENMMDIVDIQLEKLTSRLSDRDLQLLIDDPAKRFLVETGYNPLFGARPLKRTIQRQLEDHLAMMLLNGQLTEGETIKISTKGAELDFQLSKKE